ncbi:retrovirus-related pol polyprotein from transposon TNT 1-94 [Tanacetum coccineum]
MEYARSAYACNDAMNVSCNSRLYASYDVNDLFVFDDVSIRNSQVSKMSFRKKSRDSLNVHSRSNSNKSLPRTVFRLSRFVFGSSIRMLNSCDGLYRALLTNFVEKFLGTVRFGNNDFAVIAGYGDVGFEVAFRKSTCFVRNEDGVDFGADYGDASSSQSWLWHQRLSHLNFATINNLVKNNLVRGLPKMKFEKDHLYSACEQGKIHRKHHKSKTAFASNKPLYLLHMDLCGLMRVESINGKRYVLVVVDDYSRYTWVFFLHSKDEASEVIISFIKKTQVNLQLQVQRVRTDNGTEFKNKTLAKFFDEVGISQQFSAARTLTAKWCRRKEESNLKDNFPSSYDDDVQQSSEEVSVSPNKYSIDFKIYMVPNVNEASSSTYVFDERLEMLILMLDIVNKKALIMWIFKNNKDESSLVIQNKARLVAVEYCQQEGIDYDETFALVARIKAIRLFLAYAAHKVFTVFHMQIMSMLSTELCMV